MPPTRTIPTALRPVQKPMKIVKTERTHEENQERAYIAASRRSDRSLEARLESAKRASEIHKKRTGRGLKVTEQDVLNEEMYEEDDSDMPYNFRRLGQFPGINGIFDGRLSAYLASNIAVRAHLEQQLTNSYSQAGMMQPGMMQPGMLGPSMQAGMQSTPSPQLQMYMQQNQNQNQMMMMQNQMPQQNQVSQQPQSPSSYRQAPYPSPRPQQGLQFQPQHHRSLSMATVQTSMQSPGSSTTSQASPQAVPQGSPHLAVDTSRRMSAPAPTLNGSPVDVRSPASATPNTRPRPSFQPGSFSAQTYQPQTQTESQSSQYGMNSPMTFGPLSTAMPDNIQGLMSLATETNNMSLEGMSTGTGKSMGLNDYYSMNSEGLSQSSNIGHPQTHPTFNGMTSTLAPAPVDNPSFSPDAFFDEAFGAGTSGFASPGTQTPSGDAMLDSWIDWNATSLSQ